MRTDGREGEDLRDWESEQQELESAARRYMCQRSHDLDDGR
jgi:hypothetical protein